MRTPFRRARKCRVNISATVRRAAAAELPSMAPSTSEGLNPACDQATGDQSRAGRTSANDTVTTSATPPCNGWSYCTCEHHREGWKGQSCNFTGRCASSLTVEGTLQCCTMSLTGANPLMSRTSHLRTVQVGSASQTRICLSAPRSGTPGARLHGQISMITRRTSMTHLPLDQRSNHVRLCGNWQILDVARHI